MKDIWMYRSYGRNSWLHGVPATMRDEVLSYFKYQGIKVKLRYRGPRAHRVNRSAATKQSSCLMADATSFAVYME